MESPLVKKLHRCPHEGCDAAFNRPYRLEQHLLLHFNYRPFICPEQSCAKSYSSKSHLDRHINNVHGKDNKDNVSFSCEVCSQGFTSLNERKKHMRYHKTYKCHLCNVQFNHWNLFKQHRKEQHVNKDYICNECGKHFKHRNEISRHLKTHSKPTVKKIFLCPHENCERMYTTNSNLKQHISVKHMHIFHVCTLCNAKLSTKAKLNHHISIHNRHKLDQPQSSTLDSVSSSNMGNSIGAAMSSDIQHIEIKIEPDDIKAYLEPSSPESIKKALT